MKKSLIALSLAALPVAAMADVTLYGQIKAGVEVSKVKVTTNGNTQKSATASEIADFGSRIGFKGHEHLGNNLNAIWQLEQNASVAGTDNGWSTRESFIGLEGGFGKIRAGKLDTTVKNTDDAIDPWEYSNPALGMGVFTRDSVSERKVSARYDTPVFGGFSASVQYAPRDNENPDDKYSHATASGDTYYAGLNYENSGFFGQYAGGYRKHTLLKNDDGTVRRSLGRKDGQLHRLTVGYDANNLAVAVAGQYGKNWESYGQYQNALSNGLIDADSDDRAVEATEVAATGAYRFGNVTPRISYAHGFKAKANGVKQDGSEYNQVVVGADYDFSKRTTALVSGGWLKAGKGDNKIQNYGGLVGLRHKF
ncbi:trimeric porin PorB [Neisseria chenwenguii]|uniref:Porin n=1 Tax=Neisseria chenwenguii TaxID=1853278 RepID=A0A220S2E7_9NEIS|nr:trimeric porin PorB [Neisseria chenwenguii]ASK27649.1 porin [Neisseria chenwenguii]ROV55732.1 porin [Neisseria chenwenguii]